MKTVSLYNYISSELNYLNNSNYVSKDKNYINYFTYNYMKQIQLYTDPVEKITNENIFLFNTLPNPEHDKHFKKMFINHFLTREIAYQSFEEFSIKIASVFLANYQLLVNYYENIDKILTQNTENKSQSDNTQSNNQRSIISTLPQNAINLSLDDNELDYADTNTISKNNTSSNGLTSNTTKNYNIDTMIKHLGNNVLIEVLNQFDKKCFLQTW